jgi:dihydrolipoamide dehydrogenase
VATGASASSIPGVTPDGERVVIYREAILQERLPKSMVIMGAGAIGLEFATVWSSYGTDVTLVEMLPRIAPTEDEEVSQELAKAFTKRGIKVLAGTRVESVEVLKTKVKVKVQGPNGAQELEAEQALVAAGFRPNTKDLGLEAAGVRLSERGFVEIDDRMATNVAGIWAIGDVTGKLMLAHVASAMGIVCAENIAGVDTVVLSYDNMPRAFYCQPQVGAFGLSEAQAKERGHEVKVGRFPFQANGKALGLGDYAGWVKIVTDARYGEILGAHMVGPEVTELIAEATLAIEAGLSAEDVALTVHAHPTLAESMHEVAEALHGHAIHIYQPKR